MVLDRLGVGAGSATPEAIRTARANVPRMTTTGPITLVEM